MNKANYILGCCTMRSIASRLKEINNFFYHLVPSHFKGVVEKLKGPKPADHIWCARIAVAVSLRHFQSMTKWKLNVSQQAQSLGISRSVGMKVWNVTFPILNAFSASLPVPLGFVHRSLVVSLKNPSFYIISLKRRVPKACRVRFVLFVVLFWDLFFFLFLEQQCISSASREANILSTLELCSLFFFSSAGSHTWLSVVAAAGELNFRGLADRSKFRSLCL